MTTRRFRHLGFTLIELLVTIGIIGLLVGLTFPAIVAMNNQSRVGAGVNTVSVAAQAARMYVDKEKTYNTDPLAGGGPFKGIAILFAPSGEVRLLRHHPGAAIGETSDVLDYVSTQPPGGRVGFEDIPERDYIAIPESTRVLGIIREDDGSTAGRLIYIKPPFAIRYDGEGHLVSGSAEHITGDDSQDQRLVYYNGDGDVFPYDSDGTGPAASVDLPEYIIDADYDTSDPKTGNQYDFEEYQSTLSDHWEPDLQRYLFPVEEIDTVVGVRVVDERYYAASENMAATNVVDRDGVINGAPDDAYADIFFSRYTGSPMRNR